MKLFFNLVMVGAVGLTGCSNSLPDIAFKNFEREAAEAVAHQKAQDLGYSSSMQLWGDTEKIRPGVYRVYFKQGQEKIRLRVENGKVTQVAEW